MTIPTPAEPKYSDAEFSPLYVALLNARDAYERSAGNFKSKDRITLRKQCNLISEHMESLLASRQATPDKAGVSDADVEAACNAYNEAEAPSGNATLAGMRAALTHFAQQSAEAVRDGWVMVPLEPTQVMLKAGIDVPLYGQFYPGHTADESEYVNEKYHAAARRGQIYKAMIDAAMQEQSHD